MKRFIQVLLVLFVVGAGLYFFLNRTDSSEGEAPVLAGAAPDAALLVRGEYLTKAADCIACHTVAGKGQPFAGGVPFVLPFGTIYSSNITADPATGIGCTRRFRTPRTPRSAARTCSPSRPTCSACPR
jgi:hypothetical protein